MTDRIHFEDLTVGETREFGSYEMTREEIVEYGRRFDPQPYHVDEDAGEAAFGGLIASALHTLSVAQRIVADNLYRESVTKSGAGFESIDCTALVKPGDTLRVRATILEKRALNSLPDRGIVHIEYTVLNQNDEEVLNTVALPFFARRDALE